MQTCTYLIIRYRLNIHWRGTYKTRDIYLREGINWIISVHYQWQWTIWNTLQGNWLPLFFVVFINTPQKQKAKQVGKSQSWKKCIGKLTFIILCLPSQCLQNLLGEVFCKSLPNARPLSPTGPFSLIGGFTYPNSLDKYLYLTTALTWGSHIIIIWLVGSVINMLL